MRGPWQSEFGLHAVEANLEEPGGGLSVQDINGKIEGEDRGKQDSGQKASTSPKQSKVRAEHKKETVSAKVNRRPKRA